MFAWIRQTTDVIYCHSQLQWNSKCFAPQPTSVLSVHTFGALRSILRLAPTITAGNAIGTRPALLSITALRSHGAVHLLRATAGTAKRVLAVVILSVCLSVCLSRPGTDSSPGEIETPGFHR